MTDEGRKAGWYETKAGGSRYYDGKTWTTAIEKPDSPYGFVFLGLLVSAFGFAVFLGGNSADGGEILVFAGAVIAAIGTTMISVGTIAAGVRFGMRHHEYERQLRGIIE